MVTLAKVSPRELPWKWEYITQGIWMRKQCLHLRKNIFNNPGKFAGQSSQWTSSSFVRDKTVTEYTRTVPPCKSVNPLRLQWMFVYAIVYFPISYLCITLQCYSFASGSNREQEVLWLKPLIIVLSRLPLIFVSPACSHKIWILQQFRQNPGLSLGLLNLKHNLAEISAGKGWVTSINKSHFPWKFIKY